jgi:hypothetical protein
MEGLADGGWSTLFRSVGPTPAGRYVGLCGAVGMTGWLVPHFEKFQIDPKINTNGF